MTVGSVTVGSSTRLRVSWTPPTDYEVDTYALRAIDQVTGAQVGMVVPGDRSSAVLEQLKAGTTYTLQLTACLDPVCIYLLPAEEDGVGQTDEEVWQIQGTGASFDTAVSVVEDGNTKPYALPFGSWSGQGLEGRLQLYYDPYTPSEKGVRMALTAGPATDGASVSQFEPVAGVGLRRRTANDPTAVGPTPATFQAVPLAWPDVPAIRLFYESEDPDGRGRVYSLDSWDGYLGQDFNSDDASAMCEIPDYGTGGPCEPSLVLGVDGDAVGANPGVEQVRQFKMGYPTTDSFLWDGAPGTFMFLTVHLTDAASTCSATYFNAGYAVYDGTDWALQYEPPDGPGQPCPLLFKGVQSPTPVHIRGVRYKLYYSRNHATDPAAAGPGAVKPVQLLYGDGAVFGSPTVVDYGDWEGLDLARPVHFLWPDGTSLTEDEESGLDDFQVLMPTGDPALQVMYTNMPCEGPSCPSPVFIGMAVLLNP